MDKKNNLISISNMKNIALILVLLGHSGCIYAGKWDYSLVNSDSESIRYITEYIYSFHMPLYVFISGYIYYYNRQILSKYKSTKIFIINKAKRLLVPYLITGVFFMIPLQMIFNVYTDKQTYIHRVIYGIILGRSPAHLWFLLMLFNLFVIFRLIERKISNNYWINIILLMFISIGASAVPNIYEISSAFSHLIYFYIGYIFSKESDRYRSILRATVIKYLTIQVALFNLSYFMINNIGFNSIYIKLIKIFVNRIVAILGVMVMFFIIQYLCNNSLKYVNLMKSNIYRVIDKNNFYIYLVHQPIMLSIIVEIKFINLRPISVYFLLFFATLALSLVVSLLITNLRRNFRIFTIN